MSGSPQKQGARFGHTELPSDQQAALARAKKFAWLSLAYYAAVSALIYTVLGGSQAMKANWFEALLAVVPPASFLVTTRVISRRPTGAHPYGFHGAVDIGHLVSGLALVTLGGYLLIESGLGLIQAERPTVGSIDLFGHSIWFGWIMIGVLTLGVPIPVYLGRVKKHLAQTLHDRVLYADAQMNKADWMTNAAAAVGVLGIGLGWWWADAAAAAVVSISISRDGVKNVRGAVDTLMDARAKTFDSSRHDPLSDRLDQYLGGLEWVEVAKSRVRDNGHVYHVESFVVPVNREVVRMEDLQQARLGCIELDWKINDLVVVPVEKLPEEFLPEIDTPGGPGR